MTGEHCAPMWKCHTATHYFVQVMHVNKRETGNSDTRVLSLNLEQIHTG